MKNWKMVPFSFAGTTATSQIGHSDHISSETSFDGYCSTFVNNSNSSQPSNHVESMDFSPKIYTASTSEAQCFPFPSSENSGQIDADATSEALKKIQAQPLNGTVLVRMTENRHTATVVDVGPGARTESGVTIPIAVNVGDEVYLPECGGTKVLDEKDVFLYKDADLLAKVIRE